MGLVYPRKFVPPLDPIVFGALPGEGHSYHIVEGEGPAVTRTPDGSYHVSYVRIAWEDDEKGGAKGDAQQSEEASVEESPKIEVLYQESFSDPFKAGMEYQELVAYAPDLPDDPPGIAARRREYRERDLLERKIEDQQESRRYLVEQYDEDLKALDLKE